MVSRVHATNSNRYIFISPLPHAWRVVTYLERVLPKKTSNEQIITLSCKISRLKTLHLYYCNAYDKQTWQEASTHKVIWPFDQVVLWSNVKIKYVIFALPQGSGPPSIAQGLRGCYKGFSPIKSHNPITTWPQGMRSFLPIKSNNPTTTWSREVTLQIEKVLSPLPQHL